MWLNFCGWLWHVQEDVRFYCRHRRNHPSWSCTGAFCPSSEESICSKVQKTMEEYKRSCIFGCKIHLRDYVYFSIAHTKFIAKRTTSHTQTVSHFWVFYYLLQPFLVQVLSFLPLNDFDRWCTLAQQFGPNTVRNTSILQHLCELAWQQIRCADLVDVKSVLSVQWFETKIRQTLDKNPQKWWFFSQDRYWQDESIWWTKTRESPKDVQSSLGAHTYWQHCAKMNPKLLDLEPNKLSKEPQECLDKMSYLSLNKKKGWHVTSSSPVAETAKCSRPSNTDLMFVAMEVLVERIHVEDLIVNRNATARSYPCVLGLTFCFLSLLFLGFVPWLPNSQSTFHDTFWRATHD